MIELSVPKFAICNLRDDPDDENREEEVEHVPRQLEPGCDERQHKRSHNGGSNKEGWCFLQERRRDHQELVVLSPVHSEILLRLFQWYHAQSFVLIRHDDMALCHQDDRLIGGVVLYVALRIECHKMFVVTSRQNFLPTFRHIDEIRFPDIRRNFTILESHHKFLGVETGQFLPDFRKSPAQRRKSDQEGDQAKNDPEGADREEKRVQILHPCGEILFQKLRVGRRCRCGDPDTMSESFETFHRRSRYTSNSSEESARMFSAHRRRDSEDFVEVFLPSARNAIECRGPLLP